MFKVNEDIKGTIVKYFGPQYELRQKDIVKMDNGKIKLKLQYGNHHSKINSQTSNQNQWTAFVKLINSDPRNQIPDPNLMIKRVTFNLDETFLPRQVVVLEQPFKVTRLGWGTFEIDTLIEYHPQFKPPNSKVSINLSFESDLIKTQQPIYIDNNQEFQCIIFYNKRKHLIVKQQTENLILYVIILNQILKSNILLSFIRRKCYKAQNFIIQNSTWRSDQYCNIWIKFCLFHLCISQWANNEILPSIAEFKEVGDVIQYYSPVKLLSFYSEKQSGQIDPFDGQNLILMTLAVQFENGYPSSIMTRVKQQNDQFVIENVSLAVNNSDPTDSTNKEVFLLEEQEQCASSSLVEQFWAWSGYVGVKLYSQQYNTKTRSLKQLSKQFYLFYNYDQTFVNNLYLQNTITSSDQGLLFPYTYQYDFESDILQQQQSISIEQGIKIFNLSVYISFCMRMDTLQLQQNIAFPKISGVLASIGSIVSSLLFLSYIAILINQKRLEEEAIFDVIKMFFPEFEELVIKKSLFGMIKSIKNKSTYLFYDVQEYKQYYERLTQVAEQKLCMSNQIYELSRLQFAIQQLITKDELVKFRDKHYKISIKTSKIKQKDLAKIKQPSFSQIQPSNDRDSRILEIYDLKEEDVGQTQKYDNLSELRQIVQQSDKNITQTKEESNPKSKQNKTIGDITYEQLKQLLDMFKLVSGDQTVVKQLDTISTRSLRE